MFYRPLRITQLSGPRIGLFYLGMKFNSYKAIFIPPATKLRWYIGFTMSVCLSVRLSVRLSVCPLTFRVRPVASTVQDGFFPYLVQKINSLRGCVACDDP